MDEATIGCTRFFGHERPSVADGLMATAALLALAVTLLFVVKITADGITTGPGANPLGP